MLGEYTNRYTDDVMQNFLAYENRGAGMAQW